MRAPVAKPPVPSRCCSAVKGPESFTVTLFTPAVKSRATHRLSQEKARKYPLTGGFLLRVGAMSSRTSPEGLRGSAGEIRARRMSRGVFLLPEVTARVSRTRAPL